MKCKFCDGQGYIWINTYYIKVEKIELEKPVMADCPKCNGTCKAIE